MKNNYTGRTTVNLLKTIRIGRWRRFIVMMFVLIGVHGCADSDLNEDGEASPPPDSARNHEREKEIAETQIYSVSERTPAMDANGPIALPANLNQSDVISTFTADFDGDGSLDTAFLYIAGARANETVIGVLFSDTSKMKVVDQYGPLNRNYIELLALPKGQYPSLCAKGYAEPCTTIEEQVIIVPNDGFILNFMESSKVAYFLSAGVWQKEFLSD